MEEAEKIPLSLKLIPILGLPGGHGDSVRLSSFVTGRLAQRRERRLGDLRESSVEDSARCRGGTFRSQAAGSLSGSAFQANPGGTSFDPIHRGRPIVRLKGVQLPASGVDNANGPPGIKQNGDFRMIGIDGGGRHSRLEYPLRVLQKEVHDTLIGRNAEILERSRGRMMPDPGKELFRMPCARPADSEPSRSHARAPCANNVGLHAPGGKRHCFPFFFDSGRRVHMGRSERIRHPGSDGSTIASLPWCAGGFAHAKSIAARCSCRDLPAILG